MTEPRWLGSNNADCPKNNKSKRVLVGPYDEDDDENDSSIFEENSFEDPRCKERQEEKETDDNASDSTLRCSQVSLVCVSRVELSVGHEELVPLLVVLVNDSANNSKQETGGNDPNNDGHGQRKSESPFASGGSPKPPKRAAKPKTTKHLKPAF